MNQLLWSITLSSSLLMMSCSPTNKKTSASPHTNSPRADLSISPTDYEVFNEQQKLHTPPQQIDPEVVMNQKIWLEGQKMEFINYRNFLNEEIKQGKGSSQEMEYNLSRISPNLEIIERQLQQIELYLEGKTSSPYGNNSKTNSVGDIDYPIFNEQQRRRLAQQQITLEATINLKNQLESQKKEILKLRDDLSKKLETLKDSYDEGSLEQRRDITHELSLVPPNLDSIERQLQQIELHLASMPD